MNVQTTPSAAHAAATARPSISAWLLLALALLAWTCAAQAQDLNGVCRVTATQSNAGSGASWASPMTLHTALGTSACSEIHVAAGWYKPAPNASDRNASFVIIRALKLYGGYPAAGGSTRDPAANPTILSGDLDNNDTNAGTTHISETADQTKGSNSYHVVVIHAVGADVTLDGFIVTGGRASSSAGSSGWGAGLYLLAGNVSLRQLRIVGNRAYRGGGLYLSHVSPDIAQVEISGNYAVDYGGGLYCDGFGTGFVCSPALTNVTFSGNTTGAAGKGGGMANNGGTAGISSPTLKNVTFSGNSAQYGGALYSDGSDGTSAPALINVILWGDSFTAGGALLEIANRESTTTLTNSILAGGCVAGEGNSCTVVSTSDPLLGPLQDNDGFTHTLLPGTGSPAIDAGTHTGCPATDQRGYARPQGAACDIGAVEVGFAPGVCLVDGSATGTNDGRSWINAYTDLQSALGEASCTVIRVAAGLYKPAQPVSASSVTGANREASFTIDRAVTLVGGYPAGGGYVSDPVANPTILSGDLDNNDDNAATTHISETADQTKGNNSYHIVTINASGAKVTLSGFIVTAGNANDSSDPSNQRGAGLYLVAGRATLQQLRVTGNRAQRGAGLYLSHVSPLIDQVEISGNDAVDQGGGLYCDGSNGEVCSPTLTNVTFNRNDADTGGGMYNYGHYGASSPTLTNATFSGNSGADEGGAMYNDGYDGTSTPILTNVILWGDSSNDDEYAEIFDDNAVPHIDHSIVQGGCPEEATCVNVLDADPLLGALGEGGGFTHTMLPGAGSAAIDAGDCDGAPVTDQRGVARPQGPTGRCDIGAVEVRQARLSITVGAGGSVGAADTPRANAGSVIAGCTNSGGGCSANYSIEPTPPAITLHFAPAPGYAVATVDTVSGDCAGAFVGEDYLTAPLSADCTLAVSFAAVTYTLSYHAGPNGSVGGRLTQSLQYGQDGMPVMALGAYGYHFVDWSDGSTANPRTDTDIHGNIDVSANFAVNTDTVTASVDGGHGSVSPNTQQVVEGSVAQILAANDGGYHATIGASSTCRLGTWANGAYTSGAISEDCSIVVVFVANPPPALSIVVSDYRAYQHYGALNNYLVAVTNTSPYESTTATLVNLVPPQLDRAKTHWICSAPGIDAVCQTNGRGDLDTTSAIHAGETRYWSVTSSVRLDATGGSIDYAVSATPDGGGATVDATDSDTLVLFRDGFDAADVQSAHAIGWDDAKADHQHAHFDDNSLWTFSVPAGGPPMQIDSLLTARDASGAGFRIERLKLGARLRVRLVSIDATGREHASPWAATQAGARLGVAAADAGSGHTTLLLEGARISLALPSPVASDGRLQLHVRRDAHLQTTTLKPAHD